MDDFVYDSSLCPLTLQRCCFLVRSDDLAILVTGTEVANAVLSGFAYTRTVALD